MPKLHEALKNSPKTLRSPVCRGLSAAGKGPGATLTPVDPAGGDEGAGIIRGMAVITRGEALGHGLWIDQTFLQQTAEAINAKPAGTKQRFTHPGLSGDGLGKRLGRAKNASVDGDIVRADGHISRLAHKSPEGDLAGYVLGLAEDCPEDFGNSIAFNHDPEAEVEFALEHGAEWVSDEIYGQVLSFDNFKSPDPLNIENLPHCRLGELCAVDVVDEPAANPSGMFHKGQEIPDAAEKVLEFALGLSKEVPMQSVFDIHPDRVTGFVQRFLDRRGLEIISKEKNSMAKKTKLDDAPQPPVDENVTSEVVEDQEQESEAPADADASAADPIPEKPVQTQASEGQSEGKRFLSAFGERGAVLFAEGKTFAEAQEIILAEQRQEIEKLKADKKALSESLSQLRGEDPVSHVDPTPEKVNPKAEQLSQNLGNRLGRFAAGIKIPSERN